MNELDNLVHGMTDRYLSSCVDEILQLHETAILKDGKIRELADNVQRIIKTHEHKLQIAEKLVIFEAAQRFMRINKTNQ